MATFQTRSDEVQQTGIGNQQIIQKQVASFSGVANALGNAVSVGADAVADEVAQSRAKDVVTAAQKGIDTLEAERKERLIAAEEALADKTISDVARTSALVARRMNSGKMTRDAARLEVSKSVVAAIEEQPFLTQRIRKAAGALLGFDPQSEGLKQFFSGFETRESLAVGTKKTKRQQTSEFLQQNLNLSAKSVDTLMAQAEFSGLQKEARGNALAIGNMQVEEALSEASINDSLGGMNDMLATAIQASNKGEEVNENFWKTQIDTQRAAFVSSFTQELKDSGIVPTPGVLAKVNETARVRYDDMREMIKGFDSSFLRQKNLDRLVTLQKSFAAEAMPTFTFLNNVYGERTAGRIIDLMEQAGGSAAQLRTLLSISPGMKPLASLLEQDPKGFNKRMAETLKRLSSPTQAMSLEDGPMLDAILSSVVKDAPPEERESVIEMLDNKGLPNKATSLLLKAGAGSRTPKENKRMRREWDLMQTTTVQSIVNLITDSDRGIYDRVDGVSLNKDGLTLTLGDRELLTHPAFSDIEKINKFLTGAGKTGWGTVLGIKDTLTTARALADTINKEVKERRDNAPSRVPVTRFSKSSRDAAAIANKPLFSEAQLSGTPAETPTFDAQAALDGMTDEQKQALIDKAARIRGR